MLFVVLFELVFIEAGVRGRVGGLGFSFFVLLHLLLVGSAVDSIAFGSLVLADAMAPATADGFLPLLHLFLVSSALRSTLPLRHSLLLLCVVEVCLRSPRLRFLVLSHLLLIGCGVRPISNRHLFLADKAYIILPLLRLFLVRSTLCSVLTLLMLVVWLPRSILLMLSLLLVWA